MRLEKTHIEIKKWCDKQDESGISEKNHAKRPTSASLRDVIFVAQAC